MRFCFVSALLAAFVQPALSEARGEETPPDGFTALFNGDDLEGWHARPHFDPRKLAETSDEERAQQLEAWMRDARQHWTVEDGELVNDGKGPYLTTDRDFGDIELLIEYKTVPLADSGIYLRATPQVQIWDYTEEGGKWERGADKGSGGLFNNARENPGRDPLVLADKPFGEWNKFRILQVGARTSVWLNDKLVVDHAIMENFWNRDRPLSASGPIQLQTHGGEIRWRNIFVREIPYEEANRILQASAEGPFESIFNGRDLSGWEGPVENYEVEEGAIVCQPRKGGTIYTAEEYGDFFVQLEFKLPPGGNNGLAIRYPGEGDPAYAGMCELQVLDTEHPKYERLDPRQAHGSAYGMVPAHRGYLRPTGEWNFQQVTVKGSTVKVELNGYTILDTDLSGVTEFLADRPHPGKDRTRGHFGLAGHSDPVAFRNLRIRKLDGEKVAAVWPQFRGPNSSGRAASSRVPAEIGPDRNVVWKVPLPPGHSSPVITGERIFLTGVRGEQLVTLCVSRQTGELLWERATPHERLETIHQIGSHAQCTPATDGERVVSFFGSNGLHCYDLEGALLWERRMGPFNNTFGAGASPLIVGDRVILAQDHDSDSFLMALDKQTGEVLWRTDRSKFPRNFCSPIVWEVDGRQQIVVAGTLRVAGYDLETGAELWTVRGLSRTVCITPTLDEENTLYVAGWANGGDESERISVAPFAEVIRERDANGNGTLEDAELDKGGDVQRRFDQVDRDKSGSVTREEYEYYRELFDTARNVLMAIRPGGHGDLTNSNVLWESRKFLPFCASPLAYRGVLFTVKDGGIVTSYNATDGTPLQTKRVSGTGNYYSSPVGVEGRVYLIDQRGRLSVISASGDWSELARAEFGEDVYATPAIAHDRMYVRTAGHLYCFGD